jgi:hypothetical protein
MYPACHQRVGHPNEKGATGRRAFLTLTGAGYGVAGGGIMVSPIMVVSIIMPVSIGMGAGAIMGAAVSIGASSLAVQPTTNSTAATTARRFMLEISSGVK